MSFMENHNLNLTATLSPSEPQATNEEEMVQTNNNVVTVAVGVDAGSDTGGKSEAGGSGQGVKRGRGRPRKNRIDGNQLSLVPAPAGLVTQDYGSDGKRGRGRPRGSGKLQILASIGGFVAETAGGNFTPHVLIVNPGENLVDRIFSFFQKGPRAVCVLSATGIVSNVNICQPGTGGILKFEGRFEILALNGSSVHVSGVGGANRRSGMLSVSLAKPDGKVIGGLVESSLIAATPIQLVLGTFKQSITTHIKRRYPTISTTPSLPTDQDSARDDHHSKAPKLLTGESSSPSPLSAIKLLTATANNGVAENVIPETANEVLDNVTAADNSDSDPVRGIDLDSETLLEEPVTDVDANASSTVPQI